MNSSIVLRQTWRRTAAISAWLIKRVGVVLVVSKMWSWEVAGKMMVDPPRDVTGLLYSTMYINLTWLSQFNIIWQPQIVLFCLIWNGTFADESNITTTWNTIPTTPVGTVCRYTLYLDGQDILCQSLHRYLPEYHVRTSNVKTKLLPNNPQLWFKVYSIENEADLATLSLIQDIMPVLCCQLGHWMTLLEILLEKKASL